MQNTFYVLEWGYGIWHAHVLEWGYGVWHAHVLEWGYGVWHAHVTGTFACSFPMAAACGNYNIDPEDIQSYEAAGLELDHAYSVLDVMTTHDGSRSVHGAGHI